jgi:hypothetical protein
LSPSLSLSVSLSEVSRDDDCTTASVLSLLIFCEEVEGYVTATIIAPTATMQATRIGIIFFVGDLTTISVLHLL